MKLLNYEFKKSKYPIFKICFWILIACSIIGVLYILKTNAYYFNIKGISPLKPVNLNIKFTHKTQDRFFVCFDEFCSNPKYTSQTANLGNFNFIKSASYNPENKDFFNTKIKNLYFAIPKDINNLENKIEKFDLFIANDYREYKFSEFKNFEKKDVSIILDDTKKDVNYTICKFPNTSNYIGIRKHLLILVLSLVFYFKIFLMPYLWLFVAILIYLFNKDAFKISFKNKIIVLFSLVFGFIFVEGGAYLILKHYQNDAYKEFINRDIKNYSNDYKIYVFDDKKDLKLSKDVILKTIDTKKDKPIIKINKNDYIKDNEKALIYLNSEVCDVNILTINNPKSEIYRTNYNDIVKIVYE